MPPALPIGWHDATRMRTDEANGTKIGRTSRRYISCRRHERLVSETLKFFSQPSPRLQLEGIFQERCGGGSAVRPRRLITYLTVWLGPSLQLPTRAKIIHEVNIFNTKLTTAVIHIHLFRTYAFAYRLYSFPNFSHQSCQWLHQDRHRTKSSGF